MIKTYPSKAAYEAAEKSVMESTVSLIENTNRIAIDGVNVVVDDPKVGDIVCYDENRKIRFIALDTFQAGTFPAAWETVGVVVIRKGNQVKICSKENKACRQMEVYPYIVTGYTLDGTEHTATLKLHGSDTLDFKYTATTDAEFLEDLQSFLVTNSFTDWTAYLLDGQIILQYNNFTSGEYLSASITQATGLTLSAIEELSYPEKVPNFWRKCGDISLGIWHMTRAKEFFINDDITFTPSSDISSVPAYPVCWPAFAGKSQYQDDHCMWLRQRYCKNPARPTLDEWKAYIDSLAHNVPYMIGGHAPKWREGRYLSTKVKNVVYRTTDGALNKLYTAVDYCSKFLDGQGYLPSMYEFIEAFGNVTFGLSGIDRNEADPINRSLYAIGGSPVSCHNSFWVSGRTWICRSWYVSSGGFVDNSTYLYFNGRCVPFAIFELPVQD